MPEELTRRHRVALQRYLETGERTLDWEYVELPGVRADGTEISLAVSFSEIEHEGATYFTGIIRDVTERKERERALREERDLVERIVETSPVGIATLDVDGTFDRVNDRTAEILGYTPEQIGDYERRVEVLDPITPDGDRLEPAEIPTYRVFEEGETIHDVEVGLQRPDGERVWVSVSGSPMCDDGAITGAVITFADVTERVEYERKLEESNERLEQFAYAASHDLQEPLRMVSSYLQLLENRYADEFDADGREFIEFAVDGAERMKSMIDGLLEYSRVETRGDSFERVDLNAVLDDARADLQFRIEDEGAEICADALPVVEGDANQLRQVFQNLLENALEYNDEGPPRRGVDRFRLGRRDRDRSRGLRSRLSGVPAAPQPQGPSRNGDRARALPADRRAPRRRDLGRLRARRGIDVLVYAAGGRRRSLSLPIKLDPRASASRPQCPPESDGVAERHPDESERDQADHRDRRDVGPEHPEGKHQAPESEQRDRDPGPRE